MRVGVGRVDVGVVLRDAVLADHRLGQPVGMVDIIEAKPALDAEPVEVGRAVLALDRDDAVILDLVGQLTADTAIGTDAVDGTVGRVGKDAILVDLGCRHQRAGRTGLDAFPASDAGRVAHRVVKIEDDLFVVAARGHADHVVDLHLAAGTDAEIALDAGVELHRHRDMGAVWRRVRASRETALRDIESVRPLPERRVRVVRDLALRLIADQQLEHHLPRELGAVARRVHLHVGGGFADARRRQHPFALDLDHAGAAITVGAVAGLGQPAQMWNFGAEPVCHLPDRLARLSLDLFAVEGELDRIAHQARSVKSCAKCFITCLTGFIAACPNPQIDASPITRDNSCSKLSSQRAWLINFTAFSVPTRHGVHWPQLSSSKKRSRLSGTAFMSSLSLSTTTAAEPIKQPSLSSVPKSKGMSAFDAGRMPPDAPPGR